MSQNRRQSKSGNLCQFRSRGMCAAVSILAIAIPVIGLSYVAFGNSTHKSPSTLILANVIFRHGDRTPTDTYPTDPYRDEAFWPEGNGELTAKGKVGAYKLGEFLRQRYSGHLPGLYSSGDIYVLSSDHDRCLMSAQLTLAGLYPPKGKQLWKVDLNWQPIPVHTTPRALDQIIVVKKPCPKYDQKFKNLKESIIPTEEERKLYKYLTDNSGSVINDIFGAELLYNTLEIEDQRGLELPSWTRSVYPVPLHDIAARSLACFTNTTTMKKLKGGPLLKQIITNMADKAMGVLKPDRKFFLYSAHDLTLVSLLRTAGLNDLLKPDPVAAVLVELHRALDGSQHFIEVWYKNNSQSENLHFLSLPNCPKPCSLKDFIQNAQDVIPQDWDTECML